MRYLGASFTLTGLITLGAYIFSAFAGISHKLNLEPVYLKRIMEAILSGFIKDSLILGLCVTGLGLLLAIGNKSITKNYK